MNQSHPADLLAMTRAASPVAVHRYGGQLRKLHDALCDPLRQEVRIVLLGDSITWGVGVPGIAEMLPRGHALSDPRDGFRTRSWANEFKRAIGRDYFAGATPALSNWPAAAAGESTVHYRRGVELYPGLAPFVHTMGGAGPAPREVACDNAVLGYRYQLADEDGTARHVLSFPFTGIAFQLVYSSIAAHQPMDYELVVDGISQGVFSTADGARHGGVRTHSFAYVRQRQVEIRALRTQADGVQHLELEAIRVDKECRITNQGLIGSNVRLCLERSCDAAGGATFLDQDDFVLIQFGTNDRIRIFSKYQQPNGSNNFSRNMQALIDYIRVTAEVVLMAPGPVADESPDKYAFSMLDVRNTLNGVARQNGLDLIDHYAVLQAMALPEILADGLHPNQLGHALIAHNLLAALRGA